MGSGPVHDVLENVRRAALRQGDAALSDGELLTRFLGRRDEAAFEALVRRHGPMVLGVCRRVLGNHADAEDAFQATFLVLVRKAASVRPRERVAAWLYGVAFHTARKARAAAARRRDKERRAGEMHGSEASDARADWLPLLDEEIHRLPDRYRIPIVLCELEGKTHKEAARQLGWPQGTLSGRLSRARAELARRMKRRGHAPPGGMPAPTGVPAALAASTARAALAFAAGSAAGAASGSAVALAEGALRAMLWMKIQTLTAVLLAVALAGAATAVAFGATPGKERQAAASPDPAAAPEDKAPKEAPPDPDENAVRDYVAELRATVKNPGDDHAVYRMVIDRRFHKAVAWAARHGENDLVVELIRDYYGPGNPDRGGTALTWAAWLNNAETVQILLDRGAKVDAADNEGKTALHLAVGWGPNMTQLLLDKGADVNARTKSGETPLMLAAAVDAAVIVEAPIDQAATVHLLLDKKADVNARDDAGRTALMFAAESGHVRIAKALLSEGANVRLKDKKGQTALDLVQPATDYQKLTGAWTAEGLKKTQDKAEQDAEALRQLLERAGGKE